MSADSTTQAKARWRFSVRDLMVALAAAALVVWLFSWSWDWDEQCVLAVWLICLVTAWFFAFRGIIAWGVSIVLAGIGPAIAFWAFHVIRGVVWRQYFGPVMDHMPLALLSIALSGSLGAVVVTSGIRACCLMIRPSRWRPAVLTVTAVAIAIGVGFAIHYSVRARRQAWQPFLTINNMAIVPSHSTFPFALSADGSMLVVAEPPIDVKAQHAIRVWNLTDETKGPVHVWKTPHVYSLCFSPDRTQLAIMHLPEGGLTIHDTSTGATIKTLSLHAGGDSQCLYTPDGAALVAYRLDANHDAHIYVWNTDAWELAGEHSFEGPARLEPINGRVVIVWVTGYNGQPEVQFLDPLTLAPLHPKRPLESTDGLAVPSLDGRQVSIGGTIYDLATGERRQLPAPVYCFVKGRRFVSRRCDAAEYRMGGNWLWRLAIPFFRHLCSHNDGGQAVVFNVDNGKETWASPNYAREAFYEFRSSRDGKVVVGASLWGRFRVWRVPPEH